MRYFTAAITTVALSLALVGCGSDNQSNKASTSTSTSSSATSTAPAAGAKYTIADYIRDNHITETPVHHGDPGSPTIDLPVPSGWQLLNESADAPYGGIVLARPTDPSDPPTIVALVSKLTGDVDQAKILQYAPGELQNLPGYQGSGDGNASRLGGFQAWQLGGTYTKDGKKRAVAQKTVVIPSQGAVFVLQLNADALDSDSGPLMDATNVIDHQTTITP
ncbi:LpqN/LpqT family lipoprotein [Mycobacterium haemophilum]|uniref:Lipoprotein LpqN n=1 Tax=Mycobacterium haemophilum TaxID=29311 RepID=A0A0I9VGE0_9MYCO|nr:LpqN/LpqT family lipoprotein [Mycobacterium haemophilum]AKN18909.1 hypothetical protein B586_19120 [Mycobacterium haemophilum DSM 44634]KLO33240.1 hypothetical protein ABH39_02895 [Mycobacterium haemophilum]KLO38196.1 hypothetical protein ABH38_05150 [Mycobacterium haemophilum]KLO44519.1 hypothetical protein ABH37_04045 [Mycobacterium haemophilum]KLO55313.1 hypothetical protein ABH36_08005 [Mycobacterium haemophilum]